MLTILMGRAKTGKSEQVLRQIRELGDSGQQILLVPEHASHQAEVDLCRACGPTASRHAEVLSAELEDVAAIDITLEGEEYAITSALVEEDGEEQRVFYLGGEEISISSLESALTALSASEFTDEESGGALEIALTATLVSDEAENGESTGDDAGEEAAAGPSIEIELYRVDGESCLAVVDGESFALVPRSSAVDLIEAVNAIVLG